MPIIAPWLRPTDVVGSASAGAQLGLSQRAADLAQQTAAQKAAEQQAAMNQAGMQFDVTSALEEQKQAQNAALALQQQSALADYHRGLLDVQKQEATTKDEAAKYLQNFKPTMVVDPDTNVPYIMDAHGVPHYPSPGFRDLPLTVVTQDGKTFYKRSDGSWSHIPEPSGGAKLTGQAGEELRQAHLSETPLRTAVKAAEEALANAKTPSRQAALAKAQQAMSDAQFHSKYLAAGGNMAPVGLNPVLGDSLRARSEVPVTAPVLPGPTEGTGLAPQLQPQEGFAAPSSAPATSPLPMQPTGTGRQFRIQNGIRYEKIGKDWLPVP